MKKRLIVGVSLTFFIVASAVLWSLWGYSLLLIPYRSALHKVNTQILNAHPNDNITFVVPDNLSDEEFYAKVKKFSPSAFKKHLLSIYSEHLSRMNTDNVFVEIDEYTIHTPVGEQSQK